jgi:hypothetical protein
MPNSKSDDPSKKKLEAKLESLQKLEQKYLQKTTRISAAEVSNATKSAGPLRKAVFQSANTAI